jgi:hypothetical protein
MQLTALELWQSKPGENYIADISVQNAHANSEGTTLFA